MNCDINNNNGNVANTVTATSVSNNFVLAVDLTTQCYTGLHLNVVWLIWLIIWIFFCIGYFQYYVFIF